MAEPMSEEKKFQGLLESAPDAIVIARSDGRIAIANHQAEELFGYKREELIGQPVEMLVPERFRGVHTGHRSRYHGMPQTRPMGASLVLAGRRKDGTEFPVEISLSPLETNEGMLITSVIRDISERKREEYELVKMREAALQASQAKSEFLANMSHEIRTPMNAIIGMADLLWETPLSEEQREYVRIFQRAGETLLKLINDILDLSKVEAGHLELETAEFDLRELIEKSAEVMAIRAHEKGLELTFHIHPEAPTALTGDQDRLRQILFNLMGNAIKFTEMGEVGLQVKTLRLIDNVAEPDPIAGGAPAQQAVELLFSLSDTGIGIPADKLELIFEGFTQVDVSRTRHHAGTGLGLTISKRLLELMGGRIWVESELDKGSTFYFTAQFGLQERESQSAALLPPDLKGLKALVVDDNATNRMVLRETLVEWGALVTEVGSGYKALAALEIAREEGAPFQLVLLDCRMPGMDGFQVAEHIKMEMGLADVTVMLLTSDSRRGDIARAQELGMDSYLVKPIKRAALLDAITTALNRAKPVAIPALAAGPAPAVVDTQHPLRLLLVEDARANRILIQTFLKDLPYQVDIAENGQVGVDMCTTAAGAAPGYDLVLMDMQMPVMDGYTATGLIREWEGHRGARPTPIVALTAYALKEDVKACLDVGCTGHIAKPFKKEQLLAAIRTYTHTDVSLPAPAGPATAGPAAAAAPRQEKIKVFVERQFEDFIPEYLAELHQDEQRLRQALAQGDFQTIRFAAHGMRGVGGSLGFDALTDIGRFMESAAAESSAAEVHDWLDEFSSYLERVEIEYH
ncbi:MAG: response regulator [Chloroflexi bacterium]|nr:response regulator [Chloroflexota bacterium]